MLMRPFLLRRQHTGHGRHRERVAARPALVGAKIPQEPVPSQKPVVRLARPVHTGHVHGAHHPPVRARTAAADLLARRLRITLFRLLGVVLTNRDGREPVLHRDLPEGGVVVLRRRFVQEAGILQVLSVLGLKVGAVAGGEKIFGSVRSAAAESTSATRRWIGPFYEQKVKEVATTALPNLPKNEPRMKEDDTMGHKTRVL